MSHEQRVQEERDALVLKVEALEKFIGTPTYHALTHAHQFMLRKQLLAMREYLDILDARLAMFKMPGVHDG